jgi:predicted AlkP superfamily phosphohydrolase/phosphomutase
MLIGLDCVPPVLAFDRLAHVMPTLTALRARGAWGALRSTTPPITVPAWTAMVSGRDPGELGLYGFRMRPAGSYELRMVQSQDVRRERVWDVLARAGKHSSVLFVPPSAPPFPVQGELVSCFLARDAQRGFTFPERLAGELRARFGAYVSDVQVREDDRAQLFEELCEMTRQHFAIARHVWETRQPDFMMMVEIGPDRLHHAFFTELDSNHPRHDPNSPLCDVGERYYALLDREIAALLALADDDTSVIVASDHGARAMRGCFMINQWLVEQGFLRLLGELPTRGPLRSHHVDWAHTQAWAEGGYYARVFINVQGREPQGCVKPSDFETLCTRVREGLRNVRGPDGQAWENRVERPRDLYREVRGDAPDLIAMFDSLSVRALSDVGGETALYAERDPRGGDAANHDMDGIIVLAGPGVHARGELSGCTIQDVGVTALAMMGVSAPADWLGSGRSDAP